MTPEKVITNKINEYLDLLDIMLLDKERIQKELISLHRGMNLKDSNGQDVTEEIRSYKGLIQRDYLIGQDLGRILNSMSAIYDVAKVCELKLGLEEKNVVRVESMYKRNSPIFIIEGTELTYFNKETEKQLADATLNLEKENPESNKKFIENLRKHKLEDSDNE